MCSGNHWKSVTIEIRYNRHTPPEVASGLFNVVVAPGSFASSGLPWQDGTG